MYRILASLPFLIAVPLAAQPLCNAMQADFTHSATPNGVQFTDATYGNQPYAWSWDFGDGTTSTQQNPFHAYTAADNYEVCLTAYYASAPNSTAICVSNHCAPVSWNGPASNVCNGLAAGFTWNSVATTGGVLFANTTTGAGQQTTWNWDFGDGSSSNAQHPDHVFPGPGTYEVCLTAVSIYTNGSNTGAVITCTDTYCAPVVVQGTNSCAWLNADFTWSGTPNGVQFTHVPSTAPPTPGATYTYLWDFGDGTTSTQQNPSHTYAAAGNYQACLTVTAYTTNASSPCTVTICHPVSWNGPASNVCNGLDASFTWGSVTATGGVPFANTTTGTGQQTTWNWDFGDGSSSNAQHPDHVFPGPGTYEVCLTVVSVYTNGSNTGAVITCTDTYCAPVVVQGTNNCAWLNADFMWNGTPNGVQFTYVPPVPGAVYTYLWNFGNGMTSDQQNPFIAINATFDFEVCLTVVAYTSSNAAPCTATVCQEVDWAVPAPCAGYSLSINTGPSSSVTGSTFWASATPWANGFEWDLGDGTSATGPQVAHTFPGPGTYTVCLTAWWQATNSQNTCWATACTTVVVGGNTGVCDPDFALEVGSMPNTPAGSYVLQATTNIPAGGIFWTYGNGVVVQGPILQLPPLTNAVEELCVSAWYLPTASGNDTCWATICGDLQTFLLGVGIAEAADDVVLMAYPNPANDAVTIAWTGMEGPVTLRLFGMDGRLEREVMASQQPYRMDLGDLPPGVRVLRVEGPDGPLSVRVVVQ